MSLALQTAKYESQLFLHPPGPACRDFDLDWNRLYEWSHCGNHRLFQPGTRFVRFPFLSLHTAFIMNCQDRECSWNALPPLPQEGERDLQAVCSRPLNWCVQPMRVGGFVVEDPATTSYGPGFCGSSRPDTAMPGRQARIRTEKCVPIPARLLFRKGQ